MAGPKNDKTAGNAPSYNGLTARPKGTDGSLATVPGLARISL